MATLNGLYSFTPSTAAKASEVNTNFNTVKSFVDAITTGANIDASAITEAKIINWLNQKPEEFCTEEMLRNFHRNEILIDLSKIPHNIVESILDSYETVKGKSKSEFMNYMISHRLKNLLEVLNEF